MARTRDSRVGRKITIRPIGGDSALHQSAQSTGRLDWLRQGVVPRVGRREREREKGGGRAPHVLSRARVDNARRQTGRLAERVGTHSSMMENKGFVCHRRDRINQNKQPRTDCHTGLVVSSTGLSHAWRGRERERWGGGAACLTFFYMK